MNLLTSLLILFGIFYFTDSETTQNTKKELVTTPTPAPEVIESTDSASAIIATEEPTPSLPVFTEETLAKYNGEDASLPIYIALEGNVYDVSSGKKHYEPGGAYHFLAGTDGTTLLKMFGGDLIKEKYPVVGTFEE